MSARFLHLLRVLVSQVVDMTRSEIIITFLSNFTFCYSDVRNSVESVIMLSMLTKIK